MRGRPHRCQVLAGAGLFCALALPAGAFTVERVNASLKDRPTVFAPQADAPRTVFQRAGVASTFESRGPASQFGPAGAPASVFRAAEVAPARVEVTRQLLGELKARQTEAQAIVIDLPADVLFDFDNAELRADADASLDKAAELLRSYPDAPVAIHGHTDGKGSDTYNDALSTRRAQAVAERLAADSGRRFSTQGHGKRKPVAPNAGPDGRDDPDGRQLNRRVEILIHPRSASGASP